MENNEIHWLDFHPSFHEPWPLRGTMKLKGVFFAVVAAVLAIIADGYVCDALAEVAVPPLTGRVVDLTETLTSDAVASLSQTLRDLEARKGSQIAILILPTTQPETIEQYSMRVAKIWKIGRAKIDDGVIIVVAKDDHMLRIEVGYGLEGALTNAAAKRVIDENIVPRFRAGDFAGGISSGVARIIGVIDLEPLPPPAVKDPRSQQDSNLQPAK